MCMGCEVKKTDSYVVAWRVWYDNKKTTPSEYNSIHHSFNDLPDDGFQAMRLWYADGGSRYISGHDFYFFSHHEAGTIYGQTNREKDLEKYPHAIIKTGRHIPDGLMKQIDTLMMTAKNPLENGNN